MVCWKSKEQVLIILIYMIHHPPVLLIISPIDIMDPSTVGIRDGLVPPQTTAASSTSPSNPSLVPTLKSTDECLAILTCNAVPALGLDTQPKIKQHQCRARPNQRLVTAFGIHNCFTTSERTECNDFRRDIEPKLQKNDERWAKWAAFVNGVVQDELSKTDGDVTLFGLVQTATMRVVLHVLFDESEINKASVDTSIRHLASGINEQWIHLKGHYVPGVEPQWAFENQTELREALEAVLPERDPDHREQNPLNLLLPGYEALWRVVLRCHLELTARDHQDAEHWGEILQYFANNPTLSQFDAI